MGVKNEPLDPVNKTPGLPSLLKSPQTTELEATPGNAVLVRVNTDAAPAEKAGLAMATITTATA
jgi:hypothetical protein